MIVFTDGTLVCLSEHFDMRHSLGERTSTVGTVIPDLYISAASLFDAHLFTPILLLFFIEIRTW